MTEGGFGERQLPVAMTNVTCKYHDGRNISNPLSVVPNSSLAVPHAVASVVVR
jgi:hypothetical protein